MIHLLRSPGIDSTSKSESFFYVNYHLRMYRLTLRLLIYVQGYIESTPAFVASQLPLK